MSMRSDILEKSVEDYLADIMQAEAADESGELSALVDNSNRSNTDLNVAASPSLSSASRRRRKLASRTTTATTTAATAVSTTSNHTSSTTRSRSHKPLQISVVTETGAPLGTPTRGLVGGERDNDGNASLSSYAARGPFSPFSPMLSRSTRNNSNHNTAHTNNPQKSLLWADEQGPLAVSLGACKKVSTLVLVHDDDDDHSEADDLEGPNNPSNKKEERRKDANQKLCVFPLWTQDTATASTPASHSKSVLSPTSATLQAGLAGGVSQQQLIMVNPTAFGKYIPGEVTVETAKIVAQVAHIDSEDWVRIYRFHQVLWPPAAVDGLATLAQSVVHDLLQSSSISLQDRHASRVLIGMGHGSASVRSLFGRMVLGPKEVARVLKASGGAGALSTTSTTNKPQQWTSAELLHRYGLLGLTASQVLQEMPPSAACTLSLLEVADDDALYDLLGNTNNTNSTSNNNINTTPWSPGRTTRTTTTPRQTKTSSVPLKMQYTGEKRGAVVVGLDDVPLDSLQNLGQYLRRAFGKKKSTPRGHVLATLRVWHRSNQDQDANTKEAGTASSPSFTAAHFLHLAAVDRNEDETTTAAAAATTRRNANIRRSVSALGSVLRGELLREAGNHAVLPYRESTLTKVLQRWIDHDDARVVMIGSISPFTNAYDETMGTLRYVSRLLDRPGHIPQSPFDAPNHPNRQQQQVEPSQQHHHSFGPASPTSPAAASVHSSSVSHHFAGNEELLHHYMIADPRQRLSRLVQPAARAKTDEEDDNIAQGDASSHRESESYVPTQYNLLEELSPVRPTTTAAMTPATEPNLETPQRSKHHSEATMPTPIASNGRHLVTTGGSSSRYKQREGMELDLTGVGGAVSSPYLHDYNQASPLTADTGTPRSLRQYAGALEDSFAREASSSPTRFALGRVAEEELTEPSHVDRYALALAGEQGMVHGQQQMYEDDPVAATRTFDDPSHEQQYERDHARLSNSAITDEEAMDQLSLELRQATAVSSLARHRVVHDNDDNYVDVDDATKSTISSLTRPSPRKYLVTAAQRANFEQKASNKMDDPGLDAKDIMDPKALLARLSRDSDYMQGLAEQAQAGRIATERAATKSTLALESGDDDSKQHVSARDGTSSTLAIEPGDKGLHESVDPAYSILALASDAPQGDSVRSSEVDVASARSVLKEIDALQNVMDQVKQTNNNVWSSSLQSIENLRHFHNSQQAVLMSLITERDKAENKAAAFQLELKNLISGYRLELQRLEEESRRLGEKASIAQSEQQEALKIADEAITTQEELENKVIVLQQYLKAQEQDSVTCAEHEKTERDRAYLAQRLESVQQELSSRDEQLQVSESELSEARISVASLESERESLMATSSQLRHEIESLRYDLVHSKAQLEEVSVLKKEISTLRSERQSLESQQYEREAELRRQLDEHELLATQYQKEAQNAKREVAKIHEHSKTQLESYQREISKQRDQVFQYEKESKSWRSNGDDLQRRLNAEVRSKEALTDELTQTREQLGLRVSDVKDLATTLKKVLTEREEEQRRNERMRKALESFQDETRSKVEKVVRHRNEAANLLERTLGDNEFLSKKNKELGDELDALHRERDELAERLRAASGEGNGGRRARNQSDWESDLQQNGFGEVKRRRSGTGAADLQMRAEEIAAYMALTTRTSEDRHSRGGTLDLKQHLYALEDMKEAEIEALKARVRSLESRLAGGRRREPNDW